MSTRPTYLASKPHYAILDGLRGVAALTVVAFHLLEAHSGGDHTRQIINHGYLAVDFFFMLSGFVIGYAYDDRWNRMTIASFLKRRIIRLHPMVIMGSVVGAALFYFQDSEAVFPGMTDTPWWQLLLLMAWGFTLLPLPLRWDVRGWTEMHPLNGPAWSLYFEYIANILYALFIRHLGKRALSALVVLSACLTMGYALTAPSGDMVGGWSLTWEQQGVGLIRLSYPFFGGLLLSRVGWLIRVRRRAFWYCALLIVVVLALPRFGGTDHYWMNGLYEACVILFVFPVIVAMGAGGKITGRRSTTVCKFLGDISYPLYITHYPIIYIYTAWVVNHEASIVQGVPFMLLAYTVAITLAYTSLRFYDRLLRRWLTDRFLKRTKGRVLIQKP